MRGLLMLWLHVIVTDMNEANDMLNVVLNRIRQAKEKLDEYIKLPREQQDHDVLLKLIDDLNTWKKMII